MHQSLRAVPGGDHVKSGGMQVVLADLNDLGFIVYDETFPGHGIDYGPLQLIRARVDPPTDRQVVEDQVGTIGGAVGPLRAALFFAGTWARTMTAIASSR